MKKNIFYLIKELDKTIIKNMVPRDNVIKSNSPMNPTQFRIIEYILKKDDNTVLQSELENNLKLSRATISDVLHRMELKSLINRETNPNDSRTKKISLSPKAKEFFENGKHKIELLEKKAIRGISNEELDIFVNTINKLLQNMNSEEGKKNIEK